MHTVILGNGIIALTIAFRLANRAAPHDKIAAPKPDTRGWLRRKYDWVTDW